MAQYQAVPWIRAAREGGPVSDFEDQLKKDLENDPQLKRDAEKEAEGEGKNVEADAKTDL